MLALRGIKRGGSRDAIWWLRMGLVWGLRKSMDASQPVKLWSVHLSSHVDGSVWWCTFGRAPLNSKNPFYPAGWVA